MEVCNRLRKLNVNTLLYLFELQFKETIKKVSLKHKESPHLLFGKCGGRKEENVVHALKHLLMWLIGFTVLASWWWYCSVFSFSTSMEMVLLLWWGIHSAKCRILICDIFHVRPLAYTFSCFSPINVFKQNL